MNSSSGTGSKRIVVHVRPNARKSELAGMFGDAIKLHVSAPPNDGRANDEVCALVADLLGLRASDVRIVGGAKSRKKLVEVPEGADLDLLLERARATRG